MLEILNSLKLTSEQMLAHALNNQWEDVAQLQATRSNLEQRFDMRLAQSQLGDEELVQRLQELHNLNETILSLTRAYQSQCRDQAKSISNGRKAAKAYSV